MIIKRIAKGIKEQDWFVVIIEVMIVVVGIFIGLQVDEWRTDGENNRLEYQYLTQLHDGISMVISREEERVESSKINKLLMEEVGLYFNQSDDNFTMTKDHCKVLASSHVFADAIDSPAAIKELLVTGRIMLISNNQLRTTIINFDSLIESYKQIRDDVQQDRAVLSRRFPDLISMSVNWDKTECKFDRMVKHRGFLNEFFDNRLRHAGYSNSVILEQQAKREELHKLLDRELNITHSKPIP
ncbi:MAG: hypothetical protein ACI9IA_000641 [Enterobacterales bacterium]|jgi:hypothetical protein